MSEALPRQMVGQPWYVVLTCQRFVDRCRIETAQTRLTNDNNWQRAQAHTHEFLHRFRITSHVLLGIRNAFVR